MWNVRHAVNVIKKYILSIYLSFYKCSNLTLTAHCMLTYKYTEFMPLAPKQAMNNWPFHSNLVCFLNYLFD